VDILFDLNDTLGGMNNSKEVTIQKIFKDTFSLNYGLEDLAEEISRNRQGDYFDAVEQIPNNNGISKRTASVREIFARVYPKMLCAGRNS
jgi:hypothetical protein